MGSPELKPTQQDDALPSASYYWRTTEVVRLQRLCEEAAGVEQLLKELPGRSLDAIQKKAGDLKLTLTGVKRQSAAWKSDEETDDLIRRAYAEGTRGAVTDLAVKLGIESWRISKRAAELKLSASRLKESPWGAREMAVLEDMAERGAPAVHRELRREGFDRTLSEVATKVDQHLRRKERSDAWSARAVAELLGVDPHTVLRWIAGSGLKAAQHGGQWEITRKALREWIVAHPQAIDLKKVDKFWFIDVLGGD